MSSFVTKVAVFCWLLVSPAVTVAGFQSIISSYQQDKTTTTGIRARNKNNGYTHTSSARTTIPSFLEASNNGDEKVPDSSGTEETTMKPTTSNSYPWRVVMDIGREPLANMPFNWARQGVRMPLVVPTDFWRDKTVKPRSETVSFTGPGGAQESAIHGMEWSVESKGRESVFQASYTIASELVKRDVTIEAGTELVLTTKLFSQKELDRLNEEYFKNRDAMWSTGESLNDATNRQQSSRKWNPQKERWEQRYPDENPLAAISNRVKYWIQNAKQETAKNQRPEPESLSDRGGKLPGILGNNSEDDEYVYLVQQGVVRYGGANGPVCGLWTAQPITNVPAWDRGR